MDAATTRLGRQCGRLVTMMVKRRLSREELAAIADELDEVSKILRGVAG